MDLQRGPIVEEAPAPNRSLPAPDARSRRTARLCFAAALVLLALWAARSYLAAIAWAVVIAITIWPLYRRFAPSGPERRWLAPLVATVIAAVLLVAPVFLALGEIGSEGQAVLQWIGEARKSGIPVPDWIVGLPLIGEQIDGWWRTHLADPRALGNLLGGAGLDNLGGWLGGLGGELLYRLLLALLTFMALFLLLRDGPAFSERLLGLADRWLGHPGERLMEKMVVAVRGTVNGTVVIAISEGLLIGLGYIVAGVPHAALLALLTAAFAMLPMGAWFAFTTAALLLLVQGGSAIAAAAVFGWGAVVMLIGDNFVQPALMGMAARLPVLWTLIGILGGLESFGLVGLFLGPVIMAALLTIWREWIDAPPQEPEEPLADR